VEVGGRCSSGSASSALVIDEDGDASAGKFILPHGVVGGRIVIRTFNPHGGCFCAPSQREYELSVQFDSVAREGCFLLDEAEAHPLLDSCAIYQLHGARAARLEFDHEFAVRVRTIRALAQCPKQPAREGVLETARLATITRDGYRPSCGKRVDTQKTSQFWVYAGLRSGIKRSEGKCSERYGSQHDESSYYRYNTLIQPEMVVKTPANNAAMALWWPRGHQTVSPHTVLMRAAPLPPRRALR
jgi:hypothetical protein